MELSHNEISEILRTSLTTESPGGAGVMGVWLRDVYPDYVIYQDEKAGKLFKRGYIINADKSVTWGERTEVIQQTSYEPVVRMAAHTLTGVAQFSADGFVEREGVIFEVGDYPGQQFSMNEAELAAAVAAFKPVDLELEHYDSNGMPNLLSGKLGSAVEVRVGEDKKTLIGKTRIPRWLHDLNEGVPIKVSSVFDRATKQLVRLGLLLKDPQVPHAALFSAYATFAGARHSEKDLLDLQTIHDLVVGQGAECQPAAKFIEQPKPKEKSMSIWTRIQEALKGATPEELAAFAADPPEAPQPTPAPQPVPASQPDPEKQAMMSRLAQLEGERRQERAVAKVDALLTAGKLLPYERAGAIALFTQAMQDDERDSTLVTFADGEGKEYKVSRSALLEAQYSQRPAHSLTREQVTAVFALPNAGGGEPKETPAEQGKKQGAEFVAQNFPSQNGHAK